MIVKIAWRNIWRNKKRSFVVIGAVTFGICAATFVTSFMNSFMNGFVDNLIDNQYSHIQIHHSEFKKDKDVKFHIQNSESLLKEISSLPNIQAFTNRVISNGMIATANDVRGVQIIGVNSELETSVTSLNTKISEGKSLDETKKKNAILISDRLAKKLKAKIRSKVILTFQDGNSDITTAAFRVVGILKSKLSKFNELNVYVRDTDLAKLIAIPNGIHEIALYLKDKKKADTLAVQLQSEFPGLLIEPWSELAPELKLLQEQLQINMIILMTIIMLALIFGIINTMLMAVLERMKELGVLMAVGMNKMKVFTMIVLETIFLSVLGGPAGLLLGFLIVSYLGKVGINLSMYGEGLHDMGMNEIVRPYLPAVKYVHLSIMVMVTAVLAAIYPALRAIRLKPVDAIRKI